METRELRMTDKQKEVIGLLRLGYYLFENTVTPNAKWSLTKHGNYEWGSINGHIVNGILKLLKAEKINIAIRRYFLNELGETIEL